jgi:GNAT superfamily N-acetyltransferase
MSAFVRALCAQDLVAVHALQAQCYPAAYQEPVAAFAAKLAASPETAWGVDHPSQSGVLMAYLFCLPIEGLQWPALHATQAVAPVQADGLYLHDLALHPDARGRGLGQALVSHARRWAVANKLLALRLIAVQGSVPYWQKLGFAALSEQALRASSADLGSFGAQACAMALPLPVQA